jgi:hypothetical protein
MLTVCLMLMAISVFSQSENDTLNIEDYPIGTYKARYDRRPSMNIDPGMNYSGQFSQTPARNRGGVTFPFVWSLNRNTDERILSWFFRTSPLVSLGNISGDQRYSQFNFSSFVSRSVYNYQPGGQFWGWAAGMSSFPRYSTQNGWNRSISLSLSPSIFRGSGRIESAQDAVLANWMLEDLQVAGIVDDFDGKDVHMLARVVTEIIGDRTFDNRRRYIYRIKALGNALIESGLADQESFDLLAILSDNWLYADGAFLPHGKRIRYGISGDGGFDHIDGKALTDSRRDLQGRGGVFAEYTQAKVINEHGGNQWTFGVEGDWYYHEMKIGEDNFSSSSKNWSADAYVQHRRIWLLSSRTNLSLNNSLEWVYFNDEPGLVDVQESIGSRFTLNNAFSMRYFMDYNWIIDLSAGLNANYLGEAGDYSILPTFSISSLYWIL